MDIIEKLDGLQARLLPGCRKGWCTGPQFAWAPMPPVANMATPSYPIFVSWMPSSGGKLNDGAGMMDIIEKLDGLQARLLPGDVWQQAIAEAIAEIRRLRAIAGPVSAGLSAADIMEPLRHRIQDGIDAEKALAAAYEADVKAFAAAEMRARGIAQAGQMDADALRKAYGHLPGGGRGCVVGELKPLPADGYNAPQSGSVRAKLWD